MNIFQLLVFTLPIQLGLHFWPEWALVAGIRVDYLSPTIFLTDLILFLLILTSYKQVYKHHKQLIQNTKILILIFLVIYTRDLLSIYKLVKLFEFVYLILYVTSFKSDPLKQIIKPLKYSVFYVVPIAILQVINKGSINGIFYWLGERNMFISDPGIAQADFFGAVFLRPYSVFPHPNVMAGYLLVLYLMLKNHRITRLLILVGLILSYSKAAWLALAIIYLIKAVNSKYVFIVNKFVLLAGLVVSLILPIFSYKLISNGKLFVEFIQKRLELSVITGYLIAESPLTGIGLGKFITHIPDAITGTKILNVGIWWLQPVHNIYLLVFAEMGVLGLLVLIFVLFRSLRTKNITLEYVILVIMLTGLFDHYWLTLQQTFLLLALVLGLSLSKNIGRIKCPAKAGRVEL